jgi:hypothetical protein
MKTGTRGERWFNRRSAQSTMRDIPRVPVFVKSSNSGHSRGSGRTAPATQGAKQPVPFIVGESVVGGDEVAI